LAWPVVDAVPGRDRRPDPVRYSAVALMLHALMSDPLTPLHERSLRQSDCCLQILTQERELPDSVSQIAPSGHSIVEPVVVQLFVQ
jgi:hypothetical protein